MKQIIILISTAILYFGLTGSVKAQIACAPRAEINLLLSELYGETVNSFGSIKSGQFLFELWLNPTTDSWSIVRVSPLGEACIMVVGNNWIKLPELIGEPS